MVFLLFHTLQLVINTHFIKIKGFKILSNNKLISLVDFRGKRDIAFALIIFSLIL